MLRFGSIINVNLKLNSNSMKLYLYNFVIAAIHSMFVQVPKPHLFDY